jgi:ATP synthase F1 gamma subunit
MAQRKLILEDLEALNSLKNLAESYEEVAVIRMQKIKDTVLKTRDYLTEISDVFVDLKTSYEREVQELITKRKKGDKSLMPSMQKNGKALNVYLSSNGRLYGSVTQKTFRLFMEEIKKTHEENTDIVVIGQAGKEMFEGSGINKRFEYFEIPDSTIEVEHIKKLMQKFIQYNEVQIFYGKFGNVVQQSPIATSISGAEIFESETHEKVAREDRFIFEPTLEKIFHFFETQVMANLFSQTLLENQLARHASRVNAMEEALGHIDEESKKLLKIKNRLKHQMANRKQLQTISGLALWE